MTTNSRMLATGSDGAGGLRQAAPAGSAPVVAGQNLGKRYGDRWAVRHLDLTLYSGEVFGLLGPNGAGKTTTFNLLAGLLSADEGELTVLGEPWHHPRAAARRQLGMVPQHLALYPELSARQNVHFFGRLYGLAGTALDQAAIRALDAVGLADRQHDTVAAFSGGMKRRLNIACAVLHRPQILLLDEPTVGVDPQSRNLIFQTLQQLADDGVTIVYTTHYMEEAQALCDRVAIVDGGRAVAEGTVSELLRQHGESVIQVTVDPPQAACLERALAGAGAEVTLTGGTLAIRARDVPETLALVTHHLAALAIRPTSLDLVPASLEAVFLTLTGRRLRD